MTQRHKLVHYYGQGLDQPGTGDETRPEEWELFDLESDPFDPRSLHADPAHAGVLPDLRAQPDLLAAEVGGRVPPRQGKRP